MKHIYFDKIIQLSITERQKLRNYIESTICKTAQGLMAARKIKDFYKNYTPIQAKVREITSNDPLKPIKLKHIMFIERVSNDENECHNIILVLDQRLKDTGKNWRHVSKALQLLYELLLHGNPRIHRYYSSNIHKIKCLEDFNHTDNYKDVGAEVRKWSKKVLSLLTDENMLTTERNNAKFQRQKYLRGGDEFDSNRIPDDGPSTSVRQDQTLNNMNMDRDYDENLQRAIEISMAEQDQRQKEEENFKIKMQMALEASQNQNFNPAPRPKPKKKPDRDPELNLLCDIPLEIEQFKEKKKPKELSLLDMFDEFSINNKKANDAVSGNQLFDDLYGGSYPQPKEIKPPKQTNVLQKMYTDTDEIDESDFFMSHSTQSKTQASEKPQQDDFFNSTLIDNPYILKKNNPNTKTDDIDDFFN
ncbi:hypothetical protein A3Q56_06979 [Intoshia linei]|uniref:ENTH domain-containing protein n=1 Tax=Intoshia linei TaxID=1819745 RepID=A0A177ATH2_9BILA|nr:hypothetical protein A3Q56_06979 [Intoshia linei]